MLLMEVSKSWKMLEFQKIQIKMKKCKTFYETQTVSCLKEIVQPPQYPTYPPSDKILLRLWNKNILAEIYRNIQTLAFTVLQECSSLASRNDAAQMFFLTPNINMFAGKFLKSERFLNVLREHIIFNVKWVEVGKMSEAFWAKLYCEMSDLFR